MLELELEQLLLELVREQAQLLLALVRELAQLLLVLVREQPLPERLQQQGLELQL